MNLMFLNGKPIEPCKSLHQTITPFNGAKHSCSVMVPLLCLHQFHLIQCNHVVLQFFD